MSFVRLYDRREIEIRLRRNTELHLYELGDLDDFFWPNTIWYSSGNDSTDPVVLLYTVNDLSTLMVLEPEPTGEMLNLLTELLPHLPGRFYSQLTEGLVDIFRDHYLVIPHGKHYRMGLQDKSIVKTLSTENVIQLENEDVPEILDLCNRGMEQHWFDPRMIETNCFFGIKKESRLVSIAGIHTYSKQYRVSTLGNIVTDPDFRGQGLAKRTCTKLLQHLNTHIDHIGLNVSSENTAAIALYQILGFINCHTYFETMFEPIASR